jgi:hypothetical protein
MQFEAVVIDGTSAIRITINTDQIVVKNQEEAALFMGVTIADMKAGDNLDEFFDMVRRLPKSSPTLTIQQRLAVATWRRYMGEIFPPENGGR